MQDIFVIELDRNRYGIPLAQVCEVLRSASSLPLPGSPPVVEGVLNVRGQTAPVFDLRLRFGLPARPPCHTDHLLLAWAGSRLVAIRADQAVGLVRFPEQDIESCAQGAEVIVGIARLPDGLVLIYDLARFLSQAESDCLEQAISRTCA